MTWQDAMNGGFELLAGGMVLLHCVQLYKDKVVRGASWVATAFFFAWGMWNLYYYPHLNQWLSFVGGLSIASANFLWLGLMLYYIRRERAGGVTAAPAPTDLRARIAPLLNEFGMRQWQSGRGAPHKSLEEAFEAVLAAAGVKTPEGAQR